MTSDINPITKRKIEKAIPIDINSTPNVENDKPVLSAYIAVIATYSGVSKQGYATIQMSRL